MVGHFKKYYLIIKMNCLESYDVNAENADDKKLIRNYNLKKINEPRNMKVTFVILFVFTILIQSVSLNILT